MRMFFLAGGGVSDKTSLVSAAALRKKFAASSKTTSLDIEDKKRGTFVPSPKESPVKLYFLWRTLVTDRNKSIY